MLHKVSTTALALMIALTASSASAQNLRDADQPAEFPPSSYTGKQYVDSKGCVFVRAGFDGAVKWVPRVNRKRKVLCGFSPTFAAAPKPEVVEQPAVVPPKPAPTRVVTATPASTPAPRVTVATPPPKIVRKPVPPKPTQVIVAKPRPVQVAPVKVVPPRVVVAGNGCPGASALSQTYINSSRDVRCGPQGDHPGNYAPGYDGVPSGHSAGVIRVKPAPEIKPPPGYKAAFEEDRFNPNRGLQTREGFVQMRLVWTSGVPRRLVDQNSGRDVTSLFPGLRFPFINLKQQKKYVAVHGWPAESGVSNGSVTYSSKNTPPTQVATVAPTSPGHRYVQVGTFTVSSNANATAARLQQLGLPARIGTYKKKGKTYRIVMAGPFSNPSQLQSALSAARRAGFSDAFTRK